MANNACYNNDCYQVPGVVPLMQQAGVTCWAAATAMMINWHNQLTQCSPTMTIEETLQPLGGVPNYPEGTTYLSLFHQGHSLVSADLTSLAYAAGMKYPPAPISFTPRQLIDLMRRRQSPLMILIYFNNQLHMTHFRVVTKIYTKIDGVGRLQFPQDLVDFNDPGTGKRDTGFVSELIEGMEAAADKFPTAQVFYW